MVLHTDGAIEEFKTEWSLEFAQSVVGGLIEAVDANGMSIYINEEGKILGLPANDLATALWENGWGHDVLVGDALLVGGLDRHGNDTSLTEKQVQAVYGWAKDVL